MRRLFSSTISKLILAVIVGILLGLIANEGFMNIIVTVRYILGQLIFFMVPLIILGFVSYSIAKMKDNASKMLGLALVIAYLSSIGAAFFAMVTGYTLIPHLSIEPVKETLQKLPDLVFRLDIPPVVSVMTALVLAIMIGLATVWTKSEIFENLLDNFQKMVLLLINRVLIPILPYFIAANFCALSYEGAITKQLPVFLGVMAIVILSQFVWLSFLYSLAGAISKKNPWLVLKYYGPAYFTAVGTMSSAATLAVALKCAKKSPRAERRRDRLCRPPVLEHSPLRLYPDGSIFRHDRVAHAIRNVTLTDRDDSLYPPARYFRDRRTRSPRRHGDCLSRHRDLRTGIR